MPTPSQRLRVLDSSALPPLPVPVPVVGAELVGEDGKLYFLPDVYGQDKRLKNALLKRQGA